MLRTMVVARSTAIHLARMNLPAAISCRTTSTASTSCLPAPFLIQLHLHRSIHSHSCPLHGSGRHRPSPIDPHPHKTEVKQFLTNKPIKNEEQVPTELSKKVVYYFHKGKGMMHHYTLGAKLLWKNYQRSREIRKALDPAMRGQSPNWPDAVHVRRTASDMAIGIPFIIVFLLPVVGYLAPIFAILAPRYIPTTFLTEKHVHAFLKTDSRASKLVMQDLQELYGLHAQACGLEKMRQLLRRLEKGHGRIAALTDLHGLSTVMHDLTPNPRTLPRSHLLHLHQSLIRSGFIPKYFYTRTFLARTLTKWREEIAKDDELLHTYGVHRLTTPQLVFALWERGIYRYPAHMANVLAKFQRDALRSCEKESVQVELAKKDASLPPSSPIPESVLEDWRKSLEEWIQLHQQLQQETLAKVQAAKEKRLATQGEVTHGPPGSPPSAPPSMANTFPLTFLLHVPALVRVPNPLPKHDHDHDHHDHAHDEPDEHHRHTERDEPEAVSPTSVKKSTEIDSNAVNAKR